MTISLAGQGGDGGSGHRRWMSLLSDSESQRVSASDQKLSFMSRWLQERTVSKSSSSVTKRPLGEWLAGAAALDEVLERLMEIQLGIQVLRRSSIKHVG